MFNLKILNSDFGLKDKEMNNPRLRYGARGIIENENGEIAVFNKQVKNEYKLPGGGIDTGEDPISAFKREAIEETGCEIENVEMIGEIIEEQSDENFVQHSYVFKSKVKTNTHQLNLTEKEKEEGAVLHWLEPKRALEIMQDCIDKLNSSTYDNVYRSKFMVKRDIAILQAYLTNE